jgi:4-hydroxybenzoate polyprenyltransferase
MPAPTLQPVTPGASATPSPAATLTAKLALAAADIKLSHSVFALPFAVLGAVLARPVSESAGTTAGKLGLVVLCMVLARTWAMLVNRIADARFDIQNPRTARRAVASGALSPRDAKLLAAACVLGFIAAASGFGLLFSNWWPAALSVPVLAWLAFYSFAKRFTALCHLLLGSALAISPLAAALAVNPAALSLSPVAMPALYCISGMVTLWVAGFDVLYALQDADFDRRIGLFSLPSRLGNVGAVWLSRLMHVGAAGCLVLAVLLDARLQTIFPFAVGIAACCLVMEHIVLIRRGLAGLPLAFFTLNGIVSLVLGASGIADVIW